MDDEPDQFELDITTRSASRSCARTSDAASHAAAVVAADYRIGTGWIDTNLPSQIIRFGAYCHGVKNRDSWPGVIFVFGRMS